MPEQIMPLSEIAKQVNVNKSKLAYYVKLRLLEPVSKFPDIKLFLFNLADVKRRLRQIEELRKRKYRLGDMGPKLK